MANHGAISETQFSYDVFLSFRGEDTRHTFTGYLYDAFRRKGIISFMDDEQLRVGEQIRPALLKAIEESRISIIVFSKNYAASTWCLDELVKILECKKEKNQSVIPIFYKVEPSDLRHQRNSYGEAMAAHENRFGDDSEKVHKWRSALFHISNLTGYHYKEGYEFKFIQEIVRMVNAKCKVSPKQLHMEEHVVGLEYRVEEVKSSLLDIESNNSSCMLGIHGTGGIGKTTLAKALYNSICDQFECACFLFNIRKISNQDKSQLRLQQMLLSEMLEEGKIELGSVDKGISTIKDRLSKERVLIVLDDVDKIEQLKELAGGCDWFGSGSRIIITTRDKYLLDAHQVKKIYKMNVLNKRESLELFYQNAFKMSNPATKYEDLSNRAIRYAKGLPLALKVIGSNLIGKDLDEWKSALDKYEKNSHRDIQSILRLSYDSLECNEQDIFLDIACFFNGKRLDYVKRILYGREFFPEDGIRILVDKSLITVENGRLRMHDLIQDMGREIVKQEAPKEVGERSRLWFHKDVLEVLTENTGSNKIEGIKLDYREDVNWIDTAFDKMKKLKILIVRNTSSFSSGPTHLPNSLRLLDWKGYPSQSFPAGFYPEKIAAFNLPCSALVLEKPFQKFEHLTYMNFSYCQSITQFPDVSGAKNLRELRLDRCKKLVKVDESVGFLPNLVYLSASECIHLRSFLPRICLPSLEYLSFNLCRRLAHFPDIMGKIDKPLNINMRQTAIKELPHSFCNLTGLNYLDMTSCKGLQDLPSSLFMLPNLVTLKIEGSSQLRESFRRLKGSHSMAECCPNLETLHFSRASLSDEDLHVIIQSFPNLKDLNVSSNHFVFFPASIKESNCLTSLDVSYCVKLQEIPELPSSIQKVDARHCNSLTSDTSSMLWSQARKKIKRLEIVIPNTEIPEWFDYRDKGGIPIFWVRGKLPIVALAFVFEKVSYQVVGLHLLIESEPVHYGQRQQYHNFIVAEDHVLLCDLRVLFSVEEREGLDARVGYDNDWKSVEVNCEKEMILSYWGVYVYREETNMDDIQFTSPYPDSSGSGFRKRWLEEEDWILSSEDEKRSETASSCWEDGAISETNFSYDVFLSFRGEDTRHTFTGHLYDALCRKGFNVFMDDEMLRGGELISPALLTAIEESRISIVVLSQNYASSTWCLDELVKILECRKQMNQHVLPIFYKMQPSDVGHQRNEYGVAMTAHEIRFRNALEKVHKWRSALCEASNLSGFEFNTGYEHEFIKRIAKRVSDLLPNHLYIGEHIVGLKSRVEEVMSLLDIKSTDTVRMVGIHGTGGIGKTTLAKALYNLIVNQFEVACYLADVRETSNQHMDLVHLQETILSKVLMDDGHKLSNVDEGASMIKKTLCHLRFLLVLDDVDNIHQLRKLAGKCDWFGPGSRIIITTRNKHLLDPHQVEKTFEMKVLNDQDSLELFCWYAFKMNCPQTNYEDLSNHAIRYAKGLPLALQVIGSNLNGRHVDDWICALNIYEDVPHIDIQRTLRISYDSLYCDEKDIFLDIACFFEGQKLDYVESILEACYFSPKCEIGVLVDKSLISIEGGELRMHDIIQDMGREVVRQDAPSKPGLRSRLWFCKDVIEVLKENSGSRNIEGIILDPPQQEEIEWSGTAFEKMDDLRILIIKRARFSQRPTHLPNSLRLLDWEEYPSESFPPDFYPKKIAAFNLPCSALVLEKPFQKFEHLTYMNFSYCQSITQFPDVSGAKNLRELRLDRCNKLVKVDESVGFLRNLVYLSASGCIHLKSFLPRICLPSLEYLSFNLCRRLAHFPDIMGKMDKPLKINMRQTAIKELPHSFCNLTGLNYVDMTSCKGLQDLPSSLFLLPNLVTLKIEGCSQLRESFRRLKGSHSIAECYPNLETLHFSSASLSDEDLHVIIQSFPNLKDLNVSSNHFVSFPASIKESNCLTSLDVSYCVKLQEIPELPSSIQKVDARHCNSLTSDTSSMLWSQARKKIKRLEIVIPNTEIPEWFDYHHKGGIPIFWARSKLPIVALAFVFEKVSYQAVGLHLLIESEPVHHHRQRQQYHNFIVAEDHVLLCDLRVLLSVEEWEGVDARVGHDNDWKSVQVNCEKGMILRYWGVYVYREETNMDDILFMRPYPEFTGLGLGKRLLEVQQVERSSGSDLEDEEDQDHEDYSTLEWLAETILSDEEEGESEREEA